MTYDHLEFRQAMGRFATGVTVVTTLDAAGAPVGVTVNSFGSVSLKPPLVLFCLDRQALAFPAFSSARHFAVNVLRESQRGLSEAFSNNHVNVWGEVAYARGRGGCPILAGCLANIECSLDRLHGGGDHVILVGRVEAVACADTDSPLVYYQGRYSRLDGPIDG